MQEEQVAGQQHEEGATAAGPAAVAVAVEPTKKTLTAQELMSKSDSYLSTMKKADLVQAFKVVADHAKQFETSGAAASAGVIGQKRPIEEVVDVPHEVWGIKWDVAKQIKSQLQYTTKCRKSSAKKPTWKCASKCANDAVFKELMQVDKPAKRMTMEAGDFKKLLGGAITKRIRFGHLSVIDEVTINYHRPTEHSKGEVTCRGHYGVLV